MTKTAVSVNLTIHRVFQQCYQLFLFSISIPSTKLMHLQSSACTRVQYHFLRCWM